MLHHRLLLRRLYGRSTTGPRRTVMPMPRLHRKIPIATRRRPGGTKRPLLPSRPTILLHQPRNTRHTLHLHRQTKHDRPVRPTTRPTRTTTRPTRRLRPNLHTAPTSNQSNNNSDSPNRRLRHRDNSHKVITRTPLRLRIPPLETAIDRRPRLRDTSHPDKMDRNTARIRGWEVGEDRRRMWARYWRCL